MTGVHRSEAWLQAQLKRTGKQIAEGAVQAMERDIGRLQLSKTLTGALAQKPAQRPRAETESARNGGRSGVPTVPHAPVSEHQIQAAFVQWCKLNEHRLPALKLAFAVPNGRKRTKAEAGMLKAEGVRAGVPDWWLPYAPYGFSGVNGLAIEFKSERGRLGPEQQNYLARLRAAYWICEVCRTTEHAIAVVEAYLRTQRP